MLLLPYGYHLLWISFFHPFTFNLHISLNVTWISYRENIVGFCFWCLLKSIRTLCVFWREFHPFTCKMITDREGITTAIWLTVFCLFFRFSCLIALVMVIVLFLSCCLLCFIFFLLWHALIPFSFSLVHLLYFLYSYHVHYIKHLIFINVYFKLTMRSFQLHREILLFAVSSLTHSYFM